MEHKFPYTISQNNITVLCEGELVQMPRTHNGFGEMAAHLQGKTHDADLIMTLADKRKALEKLTAGKVAVIGSTVYYEGAPVRTALSDRLVMLTDMGHDAMPWALFMDKIGQNPSENSRERLFAFIDRWETPLTPDGCFIAFKGVNDDYSSTRSDPQGNMVYNRPGDIVQMPRADVVEDPAITCASGLHACASHYLDSFWGSSNKIIALKIDPKDVVSIPIDYNLSKMRVCRYEVLGDIVDQRHRDRVENAQIITKDENGTIVAVPSPDIEIFSTDPDRHFFNGAEYMDTDEDIDIGVVAISNDTGAIGIVSDYSTINYADDDHPENGTWRAGDAAGSDIADVLLAVIELDNGEFETNTWNENAPAASWPFTKLVLVDTIDEDVQLEIDKNDEVLIFTHTATGREFSATQLTAEVDDKGQRGFSRWYGIPRTTLQDWLRRAQGAGY